MHLAKRPLPSAPGNGGNSASILAVTPVAVAGATVNDAAWTQERMNGLAGQRARVEGYRGLGWVVFVGPDAHHSSWPRCGVELDEAVGNNNGTVNGYT